MNIISFIVAIVGLLLSFWGIYLTIKSNNDIKRAKTIDWSQLEIATKDIAHKLKKDSFIPDIIITPGQKGGIIAQLLVDSLDIEIPIYTGFLISKTKEVDASLLNDYILLETTKWHVCLPINICNAKNCNVLIVDDVVVSGDFLQKINSTLKDLGCEMSKVKSFSVATTDVALQTNKAPTYYWKRIEVENSYFPWGKVK